MRLSSDIAKKMNGLYSLNITNGDLLTPFSMLRAFITQEYNLIKTLFDRMLATDPVDQDNEAALSELISFVFFTAKTRNEKELDLENSKKRLEAILSEAERKNCRAGPFKNVDTDMLHERLKQKYAKAMEALWQTRTDDIANLKEMLSNLFTRRDLETSHLVYTNSP